MKNASSIIISILAFFTFITSAAQQTNAYEVKTVSAMRKVMKGIDLSAHIEWDSISKNNLFAIAPINRLKGEVTIINGKMHASQVDNDDQVVMRNDWQIKSPFAVYTYISKWRSFQAKFTTKNLTDIQNFIEKFAKKKGYKIDKPFPFRIKGNFDQLEYHIISMPEGQNEHNHKLHQKAKQFFNLQDVKGELIGFYSQHHQGVFTHKNQFIHVHFVDEKASYAGHLDGISTVGTSVEVLLPAL